MQVLSVWISFGSLRVCVGSTSVFGYLLAGISKAKCLCWGLYQCATQTHMVVLSGGI